MKVFDFHTHYYPDRIVERALNCARDFIKPCTDGTRAGLIASMRQSGITAALALPTVNKPANSANINTWAAAGNIAPVYMAGSVHPLEPDLKTTFAFIVKNNLRGIKLHPEYQNFRFDDPILYPVFEYCLEYDLFVITHAGFDVMFKPPFRCDPSMLKKVHLRYPKLKLIAAHFGSMKMDALVEREILDLPIYFDTAFITPQILAAPRLTDLIKRHGAEYVLFGTDSPWQEQKTILDYIGSLPLDSASMTAIMHGNAERLLHIKL